MAELDQSRSDDYIAVLYCRDAWYGCGRKLEEVKDQQSWIRGVGWNFGMVSWR